MSLFCTLCSLAGCVLAFACGVGALALAQPLLWLAMPVSMTCLLVALAALQPPSPVVQSTPLSDILRPMNISSLPPMS